MGLVRRSKVELVWISLAGALGLKGDWIKLRCGVLHLGLFLGHKFVV
jgi:hypothetical protein